MNYPVKYRSAAPVVVNYSPFVPNMSGTVATRSTDKNDINNRIVRFKLERIKQDIATWRQSISEAENSFYPNRLSQQRLYLDTVLNGHVQACMLKRKNLTLLKDFAFVNKAGTVNEELTELFKSQWFYDLLNYILDAQFYGYSYINWMEVKDNKVKGLQLIKRWNVSPDRDQVLPFPNSFMGFSLYEEEFLNWSLYVPTNSESGVSKCGYGLLNKVAPYEIFLRNLMGFNGDYVELFAAPFRQGRTDKTEGPERDEFEKSVREMGSAGYAITDPLDEIIFHDAGAGGNGYKSYESFQSRLEKTISKLILGHSDVIDTVPGKLGSQQGGENSPAQLALNEIEALDTRFIEYVVNDHLVEKLINIGFKIGKDEKFKLLNNKEEQAEKTAQSVYNQSVATIVKTFKDSGVKVPVGWIEEQTGIKVEDVPEPKAPDPMKFSKDLKNKLNKLYGKT